LDSSRRRSAHMTSHTGSKSRAGVEMSNERSLLGTSLAAETLCLSTRLTSFQQFFWNQRFKPGFLESLSLVLSRHGTQECVRHVGDQPGPTWLMQFAHRFGKVRRPQEV